MKKKVFTLGYSSFQLVTRGGIFRKITGSSVLSPFSDMEQADEDDVVILNCEQPYIIAENDFRNLENRAVRVLVYSDLFLHYFLLKKILTYSRASVMFCPFEHEIEPCRKTLEAGENYISINARKAASSADADSFCGIDSLSDMEKQVFLYRLYGISQSGIAEIFHTTTDSIRTFSERIQKKMRGNMDTLDFILPASWLL